MAQFQDVLGLFCYRLAHSGFHFQEEDLQTFLKHRIQFRRQTKEERGRGRGGGEGGSHRGNQLGGKLRPVLPPNGPKFNPPPSDKQGLE